MKILSFFFKCFPVAPTTTLPKVNPKNFSIRGDIDDVTTQKTAEYSKQDILGLLQEPYKNLQLFLVYEQIRNNKSSLKKKKNLLSLMLPK